MPIDMLPTRVFDELWKETKSKKTVEGTHQGHLDVDARVRRAKKNVRNRNRVHPKGTHGLDMPVAGSNKRIHTRLFVLGNRMARGKVR